MNFMVAIIVTFCVGAFVRDVKMPLSHWLGSGALLLLSSLVFLSFGLLLVQIKSQQIMAIVGNIVFFWFSYYWWFLDASNLVSKMGSAHFRVDTHLSY